MGICIAQIFLPFAGDQPPQKSHMPRAKSRNRKSVLKKSGYCRNFTTTGTHLFAYTRRTNLLPLISSEQLLTALGHYSRSLHPRSRLLLQA